MRALTAYHEGGADVRALITYPEGHLRIERTVIVPGMRGDFFHTYFLLGGQQHGEVTEQGVGWAIEVGQPSAPSAIKGFIHAVLGVSDLKELYKRILIDVVENNALEGLWVSWTTEDRVTRRGTKIKLPRWRTFMPEQPDERAQARFWKRYTT